MKKEIKIKNTGSSIGSVGWLASQSIELEIKRQENGCLLLVLQVGGARSIVARYGFEREDMERPSEHNNVWLEYFREAPFPLLGITWTEAAWLAIEKIIEAGINEMINAFESDKGGLAFVLVKK